ncbi:endo-1,4-beta-xylanase 5-like [Primulina huaijiensis]|uniref:endo-1,4-beta-xylanase 5-like n=1 Tax=Primulina huaijiensis TaxID=1492673 RepID=UPI003CC7944F
MQGWSVFGEGTKAEIMQIESGNDSSRHDPRDGFSQTFELKKDLPYSFTAWIQISKGKDIVGAFMKISIKKVLVIFVFQQSNNTRVELWLDSVSLKDFTKKQWRDHQRQSIDMNRKRKLRIRFTNQEGEKLVGAHVTLDQIKPHFALGASTTETIIDNKAYQEWFL